MEVFLEAKKFKVKELALSVSGECPDPGCSLPACLSGRWTPTVPRISCVRSPGPNGATLMTWSLLKTPLSASHPAVGVEEDF